MIDTKMLGARRLARFFLLPLNALLLQPPPPSSSSLIPAISSSKGETERKSERMGRSSQLNQYPVQRSAFANMLARMKQRIWHRKRATSRSFNDNSVYICAPVHTASARARERECPKCVSSVVVRDEGIKKRRERQHRRRETSSLELIKSTDKPTSD